MKNDIKPKTTFPKKKKDHNVPYVMRKLIHMRRFGIAADIFGGAACPEWRKQQIEKGQDAYGNGGSLCMGAIAWTAMFGATSQTATEAQFATLVRRWRSDRGPVSSITRMVMHPAYQGIIGMGHVAIPLIMQELEREGDDPDMWFWALKSITGANPVSVADQGDMKRMADAWLLWARKSGYVW